MRANPECLCCKKEIPKERPRRCPRCGHVFQGIGWEGIDAHWRAKHEDVMTYEKFRASLCSEHKIGRVRHKRINIEEATGTC